MNVPRLFPLSLALWMAFCGLACSQGPAEPAVLYEKQSPYNMIVVTDDGQGLRTLWFEKGGARQSVVKLGDPDHLELPYAKVMPLALAMVQRPRRVLIVGLGGGSIPMFLRQHYPQMEIDVVDIDPHVVDVAKRYFGFREDARMHAYVDDGRAYIQRCHNAYDVIFLDAFGADNIPYSLTTQEFLRAVRRALTPGGVVAGNVWSRHSNRLYDSMERTYQDVFDELYVFDVVGVGNRILLALPREETVTQAELTVRAKAMATERRFPYELDAVVTYGYHHETEENLVGHVLTDANQPDDD